MSTIAGYRITRVITPAASLALVSVDDAKAALGIDPADTSHDAQLAQQIDAVSMAVNNYCDRVFVVQTYQDQLRNACGRWGEPLVTRQYPIVVDDGVVLDVTQDGTVLAPSAFEVFPEAGALYRLDAGATAAGAALLVDYTAGFDPIPADVQGATLEWLTARWHSVGRDPALRSETIPDVISQVYAGDFGPARMRARSARRARSAGTLSDLDGMTPQTMIDRLTAQRRLRAKRHNPGTAIDGYWPYHYRSDHLSGQGARLLTAGSGGRRGTRYPGDYKPDRVGQLWHSAP
jgi:hypothetical protein